MQLLNNVDGSTVFVFDVREKVVEISRDGENFRQQKVQKRPKFVQVVLQRRTRDQHAIIARKHAQSHR